MTDWLYRIQVVSLGTLHKACYHIWCMSDDIISYYNLRKVAYNNKAVNGKPQ